MMTSYKKSQIRPEEARRAQPLKRPQGLGLMPSLLLMNLRELWLFPVWLVQLCILLLWAAVLHQSE